jgi:hypothetical protein
MSNIDELRKKFEDCFNAVEAYEVDPGKKDIVIHLLLKSAEEQFCVTTLKERLSILFEYEKNYLGLIKDYKEEIKFIGSLQEDLRKERAKFFSDTLRDVSTAMRESQVPDETSIAWIKELVNSYTNSLDVSSMLIEEHTFDSIGKIKAKSKKLANPSASLPDEN